MEDGEGGWDEYTTIWFLHLKMNNQFSVFLLCVSLCIYA